MQSTHLSHVLLIFSDEKIQNFPVTFPETNRLKTVLRMNQIFSARHYHFLDGKFVAETASITHPFSGMLQGEPSDSVRIRQ